MPYILISGARNVFFFIKSSWDMKLHKFWIKPLFSAWKWILKWGKIIFWGAFINLKFYLCNYWNLIPSTFLPILQNSRITHNIISHKNCNLWYTMSIFKKWIHVMIIWNLNLVHELCFNLFEVDDIFNKTNLFCWLFNIYTTK